VSIDVAGALGRAFATSPVNRTRLHRAQAHLRVAMPELDERANRRVAVESFGHLFQLAVEVAYTPRLMTEHGWHRRLHLGQIDGALRELLRAGPCLLISGHCGNWELLGFALALMGFPMHALYRPLDLTPLDDWVRRTRGRRGLVLVDKFGAVQDLPPLLGRRAPIGFVADQNGGDRGLFVPFFNRLASTYKSIGLLAMQYEATVICGCARRIRPDLPRPGDPVPSRGGPGRGGVHDRFAYVMEVHDAIGPDDWADQPDPLFYISARYRRAIEGMVRRAPEQYFWMHRTWRSRPRHERLGRPMPGPLREKIASLPWMTPEQLGRIERQSRADAQTLARIGQSRLP